MKPKPFLILCFSLGLASCQAESRSQEGGAAANNRLIHESSPYLLLHAHNPVDWYPWGDEAIEKARREDKPIFLSVGYSTCYWCHVMEREVFSNSEIAQLMNEWFVNIKVDREERPDLDDIYMTATQLIRASGGWPNSVFLTPDLKPFFAGTYFPPEDRGQLPGFPTVLTRIHEAWMTQRDDIESSAERLSVAMREVTARKREPPSEVPSRDGMEAAVQSLKARFDDEHGGFGGAPKFPSPSNLYLLWNRAEQGDAEGRRMVVETLHKMGEGAIYDQLGGGFHRYTLDELWRIPHFEKMLYDNAHLAELLAVTAGATGDLDLARLARGTLEFVLREMQLPEGGFKSAIDAETDGEEGAYYTWTSRELRELLGDEGFRFLSPLFGFDGPPNFEGEKYTLYLTDSLTEHARRLGISPSRLLEKMEPYLAKLRSAREQRPFPLVDDKVLADWNGMMIAAMARAGRLLDEPRYLEAAKKAASFILGNLKSKEGTFLHAWRLGEAKIPAFLNDYAFTIRGLLSLYEVTEETAWLEGAERLAEELERRLRDPRGGYFLSTAQPNLPFQPKSITDAAIPSGNGVVILDLLELFDLSGKTEYRARAETAMRAFAFELQQYPAATRTLALAVDRYHRVAGSASRTASAETEPAQPLDRLAADVVTAKLALTSQQVEQGWRPFALTVAIRPGWHLNANPASLDYLVPTQVKGKTRNVRYPPGEIFRFEFAAGEELSVYSGEVLIRGEARPEEESLTLVYQACDDRRCLPPVEKTVAIPGER